MGKYIIVIILLLTSCRTLYDWESYVDYKKHYENGFFISAYDYFGKYEPVGELFIARYDKNQKFEGKITRGYGESPYGYEKIKVTPQMVMDALVESAKEKGADGLINVNYERIKIFHSGRGYSYYKFIGYYAKGMAIKRINP